jgi:hypothetical protein
MDAILEYLLEYNKTNNIEYTNRFIIPPGGLQNMLDDFNGYHLNRVEVTKDELEKISLSKNKTIEELYGLLED